MRILPAIMLFAAAVQASMTATPERPAAPPAYTTAISTLTAMATDGTNFLVLWGAPLRASVVSPAGTVSPTPGRIILRGSTRGVAMVWTGDSYLVTGTSDILGGIFAARLSRDGALIAGPDKILSGFTAFPLNLVWNGNRALLVYGTGNSLVLALLTGRGEVVKSEISAPAKLSGTFALASAGDAFVLCWTQTASPILAASPTPPPLTPPSTQILAQRISGSGDLIGAGPAIIATVAAGTSSIGAASDGQRIALAFVGRNATDNTLQRYVIAPDLTVQSLNGVSVSTDVFDASVMWSGHEFIAYWMQYTTASFDFLVLPFSSSEPNAPLAHGTRLAVNPVIATNGSTALAVWTDYRLSQDNVTSGSGVFGAVLDADLHEIAAGAPSGFPISIAAVPEWQPVLATSGTDALLVWIEKVTATVDAVFAVRIDNRGVPLDSEPLVVASGVNGGQAPAVAFIGNVYVVAWSGSDASGFKVFGRRLGRDGNFVDATPVVYGSGGWSFAVASNGTSGIVTIGGSNSDILVARLDGSGAPLGPATLASSHAGYDMAASSNGSEFLITWSEGSIWWQFPSPGLRDIYAVRLDATGALIDAAAIAIATGPNDQFGARIASDGRDFLVAYLISPDSGFNSRLCAKRLLREGVLAGTTADSDGTVLAPEASAISLTRSGGGYALAWEVTAPGFSSAINVAFLDSQANILDRLDSIAASSNGYLQPAVIVRPFGTTVAYSRLAQEQQYSDVHRIFFKQIAPVMTTRQRAAGH